MSVSVDYCLLFRWFSFWNSLSSKLIKVYVFPKPIAASELTLYMLYRSLSLSLSPFLFLLPLRTCCCCFCGCCCSPLHSHLNTWFYVWRNSEFFFVSALRRFHIISQYVPKTWSLVAYFVCQFYDCWLVIL